MNKKELMTEIANRVEKTYGEVELVYDAMEQVILENLKKGEKIVISGFGTYSVQEKEERETTNSFTGQKMIVEAKKEPKFKFSRVAKANVNED
ncbi:HU family DNA-binding protein [[Mycoplasma] gypis]|uniref:HU family DNA-binding protein n=1 Tax=[Mycoplasma] gypis TaxID=92404 RepID=A0ABZ2RQN1_9BACT|nr:HU family DNA-binding protein [[Mycoplasma] gypis]MBN0919260.1 HU family DNA-binding protein [[Mycoplasma] gypis]